MIFEHHESIIKANLLILFTLSQNQIEFLEMFMILFEMMMVTLHFQCLKRHVVYRYHSSSKKNWIDRWSF